MYSSPWFIYEPKIKKLTNDRTSPHDPALPLALLDLDDEQDIDSAVEHGDSSPLGIQSFDPKPNEEQMFATQRCLQSMVHFLWGPPGTGKTLCLAKLCRSGACAGVGPCQCSRRSGMAQISSQLRGTTALSNHRVRRLGNAQTQAFTIPATSLNPHSIIAGQHPRLVQGKDNLIERREQRPARILQSQSSTRTRLNRELTRTRRQLEALDKELDSALTSLVENALDVGTTLGKMISDNRIWSFASDAVLIDETSMAPFPLVLAASHIAR